MSKASLGKSLKGVGSLSSKILGPIEDIITSSISTGSIDLSNVNITGGTIDNVVIGGDGAGPSFFTTIQSGNPSGQGYDVCFFGITPGDSACWVASEGLWRVRGDLFVRDISDLGNLRISSNTISSINTNGNINLVPNGTGIVNIQAPLNQTTSSGNISFFTNSGNFSSNVSNTFTSLSGRKTTLNTNNGDILLQTGLSVPTVPITTIGLGSTPLITTSTTHNLQVGDFVLLSSTNSTPNVNGRFQVLSVPTSTTFTISPGYNVTSVGNSGNLIKENNVFLKASNNVFIPDNIPLTFGSGTTLTRNIKSDGTNLILSTGTGKTIINDDLTVNGVNLDIQSTNVSIKDPVITLGQSTTNDLKDRGVEIRYNDGSAKIAFFGLDSSDPCFTFIPNATNTGEVFSGSPGKACFGDINATNLNIQGGNITNIGTLNTCNISCSGAMSITGTTSITLTTPITNLTNSLTVSGSTTLNGLNMNNTSITNTNSITTGIINTCNISCSGALSITGTTSTIITSPSTTISNSLAVNGTTTLNGLNMNGTNITNTNSITTGIINTCNIFCSGVLSITGSTSTTITSPSTTLTGNLTVNGSSTLQSTSVTSLNLNNGNIINVNSVTTGTLNTCSISCSGALSIVSTTSTTITTPTTTISGDLNIQGTTLISNDPIPNFGTFTNDGKNRGIAFSYNDGSNKTAFIGINSTGCLTYIPNAVLTNEVVSGTPGCFDISTISTGVLNTCNISCAGTMNINATDEIHLNAPKTIVSGDFEILGFFEFPPIFFDTVNTCEIYCAGNLLITGVTSTTISSPTTTISGDLNIQGTTLTSNDPIPNFGTFTNDGKNRGIAFSYNDGSNKTAFIGINSSGCFTYIPDAVLTNEVVSGTPGCFDISTISTGVLNTCVISCSGVLSITGSTSTTITSPSTTLTGNLTVNGSSTLQSVSVTSLNLNSGNISNVGTITAGIVNSCAIICAGTLSITASNAVNFSSPTTTLSGDLTANGISTFQTTSVTSLNLNNGNITNVNTVTAGTVNTCSITCSGALSISGSTSTTITSPSTSLTGNLIVNGSSTLQSTSVTSLNLNGGNITNVNSITTGTVNTCNINCGGTLNITATTKTNYNTPLNEFTGNIVVGGNLIVNGITTTVNSTVTTIEDPVITLGQSVINDLKFRGVEIKYNDGTPKIGFFGYDSIDGCFTFIPDATNTGEVFTGSPGKVCFGDIDATNINLQGGNITNIGTLNTCNISCSGVMSITGTTSITLTTPTTFLTGNLMVNGNTTLNGLDMNNTNIINTNSITTGTLNTCNISCSGTLSITSTITTISGDLNIQGTTLTSNDPIPNFGTFTNDGKNRGIAFRYNDGSNKTAFIGINSAGCLTYIPDAVLTNEVVSGATGCFDISTISTGVLNTCNISCSGSLSITSTSTTFTGNLTVNGITTLNDLDMNNTDITNANTITTGTINTCSISCSGAMSITGTTSITLTAPIVTISNSLTVIGSTTLNDLDMNNTDITNTNSITTGTLNTCSIFCSGNMSITGATSTTITSPTTTISGDLNIQGTTLTSNDPIPNFGTFTNDGKNRGIAFRYNDGSNKTAFIGINSAGCLTYIPDAVLTNEVVSGTPGCFDISTITTGTLNTCNISCSGSLSITSTSTTFTGNLTVNGTTTLNGLDMNNTDITNTNSITTGTLNTCNISCVGSLNIIGSSSITLTAPITTLTGNLIVNGSTTLNNLDMNNTDITNTNSITTGTLNTCSISCSGNMSITGATSTTITSPTTTISGDLNIQGTTLTSNDPIPNFGTFTNDGKNRGIAFSYNDGSNKTAFIGINSSGCFTYIPDAVLTNEVVSGTPGCVDFGSGSGGSSDSYTVEHLNVSGGGNIDPTIANALSYINVGSSGIATGTLPVAVQDGFIKMVYIEALASGASYELNYPAGRVLDAGSGSLTSTKITFTKAGQGVKFIWNNVINAYLIQSFSGGCIS